MATSGTRLERTNVTVPADRRQVRVLRLVVAGTLSLHPISNDVVEDLRSAIDEACTLVLGETDLPGWLSMTLTCAPEQIEAVIRGAFDLEPRRPDDIILDANQMLGLFVDHHDLDFEQHHVSFSRSIPGTTAHC